MTWSDVAIAGAFVLGATAGTLATIGITRALLTYLRLERARDSTPTGARKDNNDEHHRDSTGD